MRHRNAGGLPAVFLAGLDLAEKNLAESLTARQAGKHSCPEIDIEKAIDAQLDKVEEE